MIRTLLSSLTLLSVAAAASAGVRVVHASPNAPEVEVFVCKSDLPSASLEKRVLKDVPYFAGSDYLDVPTGEYFFDVIAPSVGYAPVIDLNNIKVDGSKDYTVVAAGDVRNGLDTFLFVDDNTIVRDKARVRVIHAFEDVTVDVAAKGVGTVLDDFAFGDASGYLELDPGSYTFSLRTQDGNTQLIEFDAVQLKAGTVYTVIATGYEGTTPQLKALIDAQHDSSSASAGTSMSTCSSSAKSSCSYASH